MTDDLEFQMHLADGVLASMSDLSAGTLRMLSGALRLTDGPLTELHGPLDCYADVLEDRGSAAPRLSARLARLTMARGLRLIAHHRECPALLERLEGAQGAPWPALRDALIQLWAAEARTVA